MFGIEKQSSEYYEKLEEFKQFCEEYNKHEVKFKESAKKIIDIFPELDKMTIEFDNLRYYYIAKGENIKFYISQEQFCDFDIYKDSEFISKKEELSKLYKPYLFEAYNNDGNTHHDDRIEKIVQKLRNKIRDYKLGFRYTCYRVRGKIPQPPKPRMIREDTFNIKVKADWAKPIPDYNLEEK